MKKNIFFDLDGTLTDSGEGIMKCAKLGLDHFGIGVPDYDALRSFVGPPLRESFVRFGVPADRAEEAVAVFRSRYNTVGKYENFPYPGIDTLLETLCREGYRLFVATSKPEVLAKDVLRHFELDRYFVQICGAASDISRDSKDQVIAYLLEQVGGREQAIMVGDTSYDVLGAKAHGIPTVGVSWGYGAVADMEKAGAIAIAHSMEELLALLRRKL